MSTTHRVSSAQRWVLHALARGGTLHQESDGRWRIYGGEAVAEWAGVAQRTIDVLVRDRLVRRGQLAKAGRLAAQAPAAGESGEGQ